MVLKVDRKNALPTNFPDGRYSPRVVRAVLGVDGMTIRTSKYVSTILFSSPISYPEENVGRLKNRIDVLSMQGAASVAFGQMWGQEGSNTVYMDLGKRARVTLKFAGQEMTFRHLTRLRAAKVKNS